MGRMKQLYYDFMLLDSGVLSMDEFKKSYGDLPVALLNELRKEFDKLNEHFKWKYYKLKNILSSI